MFEIVRALWWFLVSFLKSRRRLEAENLVLRYQVNVLGRSAPRPHGLGSADRILFIWLYRFWPGVLSSIVIVRPETVVRWHRHGFKAFWRWKSLGRPGRSKIRRDVRHQILIQIVARFSSRLSRHSVRRGEIVNLKWSAVDLEGSCLRLADSKEGASVRPVGLPVVEYLEQKRLQRTGTYVFSGQGIDNAVGNFPQSWKKLLKNTPLWDVTPHVLRHSFASIANDLGFTEITIAALIGHAKGSATSKYVHTLDSTLIMAADTVSGYVKALLEGVEFRRNTYTLDRQSRQSAIDQMLTESRPTA